MATVTQLLDTALLYLGYKESLAGSNKTMFDAAFGLTGQPWCAIYARASR